MSDSHDTARRTVLKGGLGAASMLALFPDAFAATEEALSDDAKSLRRISRQTARRMGEILQRTAEQQFKVKIDADRTSVAVNGKHFAAVAPIAGLYRIDPVRYVDGVDVAVIYVGLPRGKAIKSSIRPDFYLVKAIAPIKEVGKVVGKLQFTGLDSDSKPMVRSAVFDTFSATVPDNVTDETMVDVGLSSIIVEPGARANPGLISIDGAGHGQALRLAAWCSNGVHGTACW